LIRSHQKTKARRKSDGKKRKRNFFTAKMAQKSAGRRANSRAIGVIERHADIPEPISALVALNVVT
jgi:hypothetical protein